MNVLNRSCTIRHWTRFRECSRFLDQAAHLSVNCIESAQSSRITKANDRAAGLPNLDIFLAAVRVVAHTFRVCPGAIRLALNQRRTTAIASSRDCFARDAMNIEHIVAVELKARNAI